MELAFSCISLEPFLMDLCVLFAMYYTAILSTISYSRALIAPFSLLPFQLGELNI
jgi:hypothetical protein